MTGHHHKANIAFSPQAHHDISSASPDAFAAPDSPAWRSSQPSDKDVFELLEDSKADGNWLKISVTITDKGDVTCLGSVLGIDDVMDLAAGARVLGRIAGVESYADLRGDQDDGNNAMSFSRMSSLGESDLPTVFSLSNAIQNPPPPPQAIEADNSDRKTMMVLRLSAPGSKVALNDLSGQRRAVRTRTLAPTRSPAVSLARSLARTQVTPRAMMLSY